MKWFKGFVKFWIAAGSLVAFSGGWILFGHSGKPVAPAGSILDQSGSSSSAASSSTVDSSGLAPLPTLEPLPSINGSVQSAPAQVQPFQQLPSSNFSFAPRLRSRGS